mgnify:CR=1 FL=1
MTVPQRPLVRSIPSLAQRLRASEAVIIPTDTLPGLAAVSYTHLTLPTNREV